MTAFRTNITNTVRTNVVINKLYLVCLCKFCRFLIIAKKINKELRNMVQRIGVNSGHFNENKNSF